ncbi:Carboxypeptidase [Aphelenchoides besseyi]|nr:Carboxypeptidase [Aphelenchoides besseyi]
MFEVSDRREEPFEAQQDHLLAKDFESKFHSVYSLNTSTYSPLPIPYTNHRLLKSKANSRISTLKFPLFVFMITLLTLVFLFLMVDGNLLRRHSRTHNHQIDRLPLLNDQTDELNQFAGHLNLDNETFVFYWFVQAEENVQSKPLVFLSSDGPGCSSVNYLLNGLGPLTLNTSDGLLYRNNNSWTKLVNLVVIESPSGTGFSFNRKKDLKTDDHKTADLNYLFIQRFFDQHPTFRHHDVFLIGASYGARHVTFLTDRILNNQATYPINLKGLFLGNPIFIHPFADDTYLQFQYWHGFIGEHQWQRLLTACCDHPLEIGTCSWGELSAKKRSVSCYKQTIALRKRFSSDRIADFDYRSPCDYNEKPSVPTCVDARALTSFMNKPAVKTALNVDESLNWSFCNPHISVNLNFQVVDSTNNKAQMKRIIDSGVRVLSFAGDADLLCNVVLEQKTIAELGYRPLLEHTLWYANQQTSKRPSGFLTLYERRNSFATVFGGGHGFQGTKLAEVRQLFISFLSDDYRHLLIPDANL